MDTQKSSSEEELFQKKKSAMCCIWNGVMLDTGAEWKMSMQRVKLNPGVMLYNACE